MDARKEVVSLIFCWIGSSHVAAPVSERSGQNQTPKEA